RRRLRSGAYAWFPLTRGGVLCITPIMHATMILAIDQGTTSTRAIAFEVTPQAARSAVGDQNGGAFSAVAVSQIELAQHFPRSGWVEHDAAEIWRATLQTCREVVRKAGGLGRFAAVGLTNQRETAVLWDT